MLKKLLNNIFSKETSLECKVDEDKVDCKELGTEYEHINDDPHDGWWLRPEHRDEVLPQLQESTLEPLDLK